MRRVIIGDTHGRAFWKLISAKEKWDELIFIGDYFDTHDDISGLEQLHNFNEICSFKKGVEKPVIMLIGNHDHHYFPEIGYTGTSGYQSGLAKNFEASIQENRDLLQMAYAFDNCLCSHAGVGEEWMARIIRRLGERLKLSLPGYTAEEIAAFVNDMWEHNPKLFCFTGEDNSGEDMGQTPIWIRPLSLTKDSHEIQKNVIQIVGHTQQYKILLDDVSTLQGKYYFIDTLGTSGEYLIWEDGKFSVNNVK